jgi:mannitol-1-phosphate 5-dehydrogenase
LPQGCANAPPPKNPKPLNLLLGENALEAHTRLRDALLQTPRARRNTPCWENIGLVRLHYSGVKPSRSCLATPPGVRVDRYSKLPVDADALIGEPPPLAELQPVRPFEIYMQRKLYLHNGLHALIAYLGAQHGYRTIQHALQDPEIYALFVQGAKSLTQAFLKKHPFDAQEHYESVQDILARVQDPHLDDPIARVAREPLRKLRPDDRLVGGVSAARGTRRRPDPLPQSDFGGAGVLRPQRPRIGAAAPDDTNARRRRRAARVVRAGSPLKIPQKPL